MLKLTQIYLLNFVKLWNSYKTDMMTTHLLSEVKNTRLNRIILKLIHGKSSFSWAVKNLRLSAAIIKTIR